MTLRIHAFKIQNITHFHTPLAQSSQHYKLKKSSCHDLRNY